MLPPPIVTTTTTTTTTADTIPIMNISNYNHPTLDTPQSLFVHNNSNNNNETIITDTSSAANAGITRLKNFFHKTLANVSKTNYNNNSNFSSTSNSLSAGDILATKVYDGLITEVIGGDSSTTVANMAVTSLRNTTRHLETTTAFPAAQTVATFIAAGNKNRATTIIVYPTVSPESIVIPIVSCIFGFPILAFIVICCLRHRAKLARERDRRRNYDMQDHAVSLVRFSPIHRLNYRSSRAISLRPERSLSQGFTSLELDTVVEERCSDVEQTQTEILQPESPMESSNTAATYKMSLTSS